MKKEQRTETREQIAVAVRLAGGAIGTTRNLSPSGLYFEAGRARRVGSVLKLTIDIGFIGRSLVLTGRGKVLRVEPLGGTTGVAVQLLESRLEEVA
ncbi:MAG: PilZ domain-containing protein [Immundisolibacter sp.]|uniref:PilZ domain-containing protein n=1 Tax=Immundisolibacter sp. TaxID=1934948 RepID=UPI003EDE804E